jgi:transcriptional regulator with XRE-family HTH domain
MTGEYLKEFIRKHKVSQSEIARQLGLSQQSFNQMLALNDIKSSLVERVASALHVSMGEIYNETKEQSAVASGNGIAVAGNNNVTGNYASDNSQVLQERVVLLERILDEKERTIQILMNNGK